MTTSSSPPLAAPEESSGRPEKRPEAISTAAADDEDEANKNVGSLLSSEGSSTAHPLAEEVQCCVCERKFGTMKALYGHMRCHPERSWRGVRPLQEGEGSGGRKKLRRTGENAQMTGLTARMKEGEEKDEETMGYACGECTRVFGTSQALGGHRASHRGVMGCSAKAKDTTAATAAAAEGATGAIRAEGGITKFICQGCERQFVTYHGMRVHQRIHRQEERERGGGVGRSGEGEQAPASEAPTGGDKGKGYALDLNLPPPPE
ncbi:Zinc finger protein ZAT3 [Platanthera guangdongensis]|uniref:Zinc finger protein ZAT3 n=1 Tax=Platanthera guangdongensis TaxID=2320717 RepID=A0ABR2MDZ9_9ASPA